MEMVRKPTPVVAQVEKVFLEIVQILRVLVLTISGHD